MSFPSSPQLPASALPQPSGLGSLADELAGAWSEDEYGSDGEDLFDEAAAAAFSSHPTTSTTTTDLPTSSSHKRPGSSGSDGSDHYHHTPQHQQRESVHHEDKNGGISEELEEQLRLIHRLASDKGLVLLEESEADGINLGTYGISGLGGDEYDEYGGSVAHGEEGGGKELVDEKCVERLMEGLQKLPPQSAIETRSTRLITAHAAIATWITLQTSLLRDLSFSLSEPPMDDTIPLLLTLPSLIPTPTPAPLLELTAIHTLTTDLMSQLSFISDTLHMSRQSSIAANRKLRIATEACAEWKAELKREERCRRAIEEGEWDRRIREREASRTCGEVVGGFEEVCRGMEERMREWEGVC